MPAGEVDLLARPEAPGADHQEAGQSDQDQPEDGDPPRLDRIGVEEVDGGGQQAGRGGNGHADKVLAIRAAGVARLGIVADVEARQPRDSADEKQKADESAGLEQVLCAIAG